MADEQMVNVEVNVEQETLQIHTDRQEEDTLVEKEAEKEVTDESSNNHITEKIDDVNNDQVSPTVEPEVEPTVITSPTKATPTSDNFLLANTHIRRYVNNGGNFITGVDISSAELASKKSTREQRFGKVSFDNALADAPSSEKVNQRMEKFGIHLPLVNGERVRYVSKLPDVPEGGEPREEGVLLYGTDEMSTKDILKYFMEYGPSHLEWIDDSSCVAVWEDPTSAQRALLGKGVWPLLQEDGEGAEPIWRQGQGNLLLRKATSLDMKEKNSASKSRYYKKYGNPNAIHNKKQTKNVDLRKRLERKRLKEDENTEMIEEEEEKEQTNDTLITQPSSLQLPATKQRRITVKEKKSNDKEGEEEEMEIEITGIAKEREGGMRSDLLTAETSGTKTKNDLRHRIGSNKKRQELKLRLGLHPVM